MPWINRGVTSHNNDVPIPFRNGILTVICSVKIQHQPQAVNVSHCRRAWNDQTRKRAIPTTADGQISSASYQGANNQCASYWKDTNTNA